MRLLHHPCRESFKVFHASIITAMLAVRAITHAPIAMPRQKFARSNSTRATIVSKKFSSAYFLDILPQPLERIEKLHFALILAP